MYHKYLFAGCAILFLSCTAQPQAMSSQTGFLQGHLRVASQKPTALADGKLEKTEDLNYAEYPLIILSQDRQKEISKVTADKNGNYRVTLPPGDYILDIQRRQSGHLRAKPHPFTVLSGQTVRVDMDIDTGVRQ